MHPIEMLQMARGDYWRARMYSDIYESLSGQSIGGTGVEFGGANGILQGMLPQVQFESRNYPPHDITLEYSWDRDWDVVIADQVLEHTYKPWLAIELMGVHARKLAIVTLPFLICVHNCPNDYWRLTPQCLRELAEPYFSKVVVGSWGNHNANTWQSSMASIPMLGTSQSDHILSTIPKEKWEAALLENDPLKPFVVWGLFWK